MFKILSPVYRGCTRASTSQFMSAQKRGCFQCYSASAHKRSHKNDLKREWNIRFRSVGFGFAVRIQWQSIKNAKPYCGRSTGAAHRICCSCRQLVCSTLAYSTIVVPSDDIPKSRACASTFVFVGVCYVCPTQACQPKHKFYSSLCHCRPQIFNIRINHQISSGSECGGRRPQSFPL